MTARSSTDRSERTDAIERTDTNADDVYDQKLSPSPSPTDTITNDATPVLGHGRKAVLLALFCLSMFIDVLSSSAFMVFMAPISADLGILFEQQTWVATSYAVAFGSFLLFWGRVCDLFSAKPVFTFGFMAIGILNLVISFLPNQYAFFLVRALTGVAAACVVPAAYRLITYVFPPEERSKAYTLYGMTGSIANVSGTVIAGLFELIPTTGQMAGWRWFFRVVAVITVPAAIGAYCLIPKDKGHSKETDSSKERVQAMDLPGIGFMLSAQILVIIGLTFGASYGWKKASFLAPFLIGIILYPVFFWWETRVPEKGALLPPSIWRIPNITVLLVFALISLGWWSVAFLPFIELSNLVHGEPMVIAAVRTLPMGVAAGMISLVLIKYPNLIRQPRIPIIAAMLLCITAYTVWTQAPSTVGVNYWKWVFPAMLFGSGGMQVVLIATNVGMMLASPAGREGVIGATLQTFQQTSSVLAWSIQAGLWTTHPGTVHNMANIRTSWYFELAWTVLWLVGFVIFYRPSKNEASKGNTAAEKDAPKAGTSSEMV